MRAEQVTPPVAGHAEGPVWSPRWGGLRWVDMHAGEVLSLRADGSIRRRRVGDVAAALRPRTAGGAVIAVERGFALEAPDGELTALGDLWPESANTRMNEGGCDPDGRFYCGSMEYGQKAGAAALHRLDPGGAVTTVLERVTISNGLEWSPDGACAYYVDTPTRRIDIFDYEREAGLSGRRPFVVIPEDAGHPDGLTVDAEGGVWVALYDGGAVRRYAPDGRLDAVVEVAARKVTACTFGGAGLDELFITTSREGLAPAEDPLAGALFRALVGATGLPVREFAG